MIPSKAGREFIARGVSALGHSPGRLALTAGLIALLAAILVAFRVNPTARLPYPSSLIITDSSMAVISIMVERGDLSGATAKVGSSYRFDQRTGLMALRRFSVLVLRRGLREYDPYERCYATSALAAAGDRDQIAQLVRMFQGTRAPDLRMAVADGLGDLGDADAVEALGRLYSWTGPSYQRIVVNGVAEAHDPGAIELLSRTLTVSDRATRLTAATSYLSACWISAVRIAADRP